MIRLPTLTPRQILIMLHDVVATAAAIVLTFVMRFEEPQLSAKLVALPYLPLFVAYAAVVYFAFGLHRNKWRFTSLPDLFNIFRVSTVLAGSLLAVDYVLVAPNVYGEFFFGKITILLYWFLQIFFLGGSRIAYRYFHYTRVIQHARVADATPTLVLGRAADVEVLLRAVESGAVKKIWTVGVLSPSRADRGQIDPRRAGARRRRRRRNGRQRPRQPRHAGRPPGVDALGAVAGGAPGVDPGARPQARPDREPVAVARLAGPGHATRPGGGGRPAAASERQHRLRAAGKLRQRQVGGGDRRRRLDRLGDLRPAGHLRRRPPAGHRKFGTGAACGTGSAQRQAIQGRHRRAHRRRARPRPHHEPDRSSSSPTSSSTPPRSSTCPCSSGTGTRRSRPTSSAR